MMSDDATHKNILAIKQHSEETRKQLRDLEKKFSNVEMLQNRINQLENQVKFLTVKVYSGGPTV
jgi:hypothetical protein